MTVSQVGAIEMRPLETLGISEIEERAYRWLLLHPGAAVTEIAAALGLSPRSAQRLLDAVEVKGLATCSPERPRRYIPVSPDMAIGALLMQRQKDLQRAQDLIEELQEQAAAGRQPGEPEHMVELITSREAEHQVLDHTHHVAQQEHLTLMRLPVRTSRLDLEPEDDQRIQRAAQARGVQYRSIVDADFLAFPGVMNRIRADIKAGEEVRVFSPLPLKLVLVDRRIAVIPLHLQESDSPTLLVRSSALLDALYTLFQIMWERAAPVSFTRGGELETGNPASILSPDAEALIALMAAGMNDKTIAADLGLSTRTLNRRIVELMQTLNARTRFQIGWLAALHLNASGTFN